MKYAFEPAPVPTVAIAGEAVRFPVRRIYCVGRNYAAHAREMGGDPQRERPFFFTKPADAVVDAGVAETAVIPYPPDTENLHHEIELAVAIGRGGADIPLDRALEHVFGYAASIDLTRRDRQFEARDKGRPWDWGKAFDRSAPIAPIHRVESVGHLRRGRIWLSVEGELRQQADLAELIWSVPEIVSIISRSMALQAGDLIMTGTPAGVGSILPGQRVRGGIEGLSELAVLVTHREAAA